MSKEGEAAVFYAFGEAFSLDTMQGFVVQRPHGHHGDFELIDRIYTRWTSSRPELVAWDEYFHAQAAPKAVVNRKTYFQDLLSRVSASRSSARILNLGSGPGRCIREWLDTHPNANVRIACVEISHSAITYARKLNETHGSRVTFHQESALRFRLDSKYDLIWAAGLFDYLNDHTFIVLAKRLLKAVAPNGELIIGNFSVENPTRPYRELGDWRLHHRSSTMLRELMLESGACPQHLRVSAEAEGVNLFVHGRRPLVLE